MAAGIRIGDLAQAALCPVETVRYYEREGLLPAPARSRGNYRLYGEHHVERLRFIRNCRSLDMTHDEIRKLLAFRDGPDGKCDEVNSLLDEHIGHVGHRIKELRVLERQLKDLRYKCRTVRTVRDCAIMESLGRASARVAQTSEGHGKLGRTHR